MITLGGVLSPANPWSHFPCWETCRQTIVATTVTGCVLSGLSPRPGQKFRLKRLARNRGQGQYYLSYLSQETYCHVWKIPIASRQQNLNEDIWGTTSDIRPRSQTSPKLGVFIVADVRNPLLCADFLSSYKLPVDTIKRKSAYTCTKIQVLGVHLHYHIHSIKIGIPVNDTVASILSKLFQTTKPDHSENT